MENPDECGVDLTRCCYADLRGGTYRLAVLPWGATEPHNLHLPYLTDCLLAQSLAVDAAARLWRERRVRAVVLPPVTLGRRIRDSGTSRFVCMPATKPSAPCWATSSLRCGGKGFRG